MKGCKLCGGVLLFLAVACGAENRTPTHFTPSNDKTATSKNDTVAVPASAVPGRQLPPLPPPGSRGSASLALASIDTAALRGAARLTGIGGLTTVTVSLAQGKGGITYEGAIRQGVCQRMGATVASLHPISADSLSGAGAASTDVPVPLDSLLSRAHVVVYGKGGRPETCAAIGPAAAAAGRLIRDTIPALAEAS